jgi:hypothetical protein
MSWWSNTAYVHRYCTTIANIHADLVPPATQPFPPFPPLPFHTVIIHTALVRSAHTRLQPHCTHARDNASHPQRWGGRTSNATRNVAPAAVITFKVPLPPLRALGSTRLPIRTTGLHNRPERGSGARRHHCHAGPRRWWVHGKQGAQRHTALHCIALHRTAPHLHFWRVVRCPANRAVHKLIVEPANATRDVHHPALHKGQRLCDTCDAATAAAAAAARAPTHAPAAMAASRRHRSMKDCKGGGQHRTARS